ncbi:MAG TPA: DUF305 domain-containing protein [Actinoplanes sp.]|nr:DUF305 domain-containing protein [Actinoplanes sp.]
MRPRVLRWPAAVLAAILLLAGGYLTGMYRAGRDVPAAGSVDAGFARDMVLHHGQAVTLAMIIIPRTTTPVVREMAHDIAVTQQREAGEMTGWLEQWGLPTSTTAAPMAWMSHGPTTPTGADPPMPGMATRADVARLAVTSGRAADLLFCRLMLAHHLGGLHMVEEEIARGTRPEVVALATQMRIDQQREINLLTALLASHG